MPRSIPARWKRYPGDDLGSTVVLVERRVLAPQLRNFRSIVVALPPSYPSNPTRRFPVIYMQDGQNLFDPATAYAGAWQLRETLAEAALRGREAIVVGVANARRHRLYEYSPFPDPRLGGGGGDRYLAFLVDTLKPSIDRDFRTLPRREATAVAGSSMGGLISLYASFRRPDVFGAAAALSPSLWFADRAVPRFVAATNPDPKPRIYLDIGLHEPSGAVADVRALRDHLESTGHRPGSTLDYCEDEAGSHNEETWGRRASRALEFLVQGEQPTSDGASG